MEYRNTILNADCLTTLPQLPAESVHFILTDPPYITRYKARDGRTVANDDNAAWLKPAFAEMFRVLAPDSFAVTFYGWPQADRFIWAYRDAGFRVVGHFVFPKRYTSASKFVRYQHECAHLLAKGNPKQPAYAIGDVSEEFVKVYLPVGTVGITSKLRPSARVLRSVSVGRYPVSITT